MDKETEKAKEARKKAARQAEAKKNRVSAGEYFRGVRTEIKKVVWPTRKEMGSFTIVVVLACTFFSILFALADSAVLTALKLVLGITM